MPEANILYTVTAVVVAALVVWVLAALKMAKEPWARPAAAAALERAPDVPVEKDEPVDKVAKEEEEPKQEPEDVAEEAGEPTAEAPADPDPKKTEA